MIIVRLLLPSLLVGFATTNFTPGAGADIVMESILAMTVGIILLVGMTRMYLGVHYPSDVASGISLGAAWSLLLAGCFSFFPDPKIARPGQ